MKNLYLIKIVTHSDLAPLQVVMYVDGDGMIWFPDMIDGTEEPTYFTDLTTAKNAAKMYGGQVVKRIFVLVEEGDK